MGTPKSSLDKLKEPIAHQNQEYTISENIINIYQNIMEYKESFSSHQNMT